MSLSKILNGIYDKAHDLTLDAVCGKDEDLYVRSARKQKTKDIIQPAVTLVPGLFAYYGIRSQLNCEEFKDFSIGGKIVVISTIIAGELMLDVVRGGGMYFVYKLHDYLN